MDEPYDYDDDDDDFDDCDDNGMGCNDEMLEFLVAEILAIRERHKKMMANMTQASFPFMGEK